MLKLATPVQYESSLDRLNEIRPLVLTDESRITLDNVIVGVNPVSVGQPVSGKFARCTEGGALLKSVSLRLYSLETGAYGLNVIESLIHFQYAQTVFGFTAGYFNPIFVNDIWWCNSDGSEDYGVLVAGEYKFFYFTGTDIYFRGEGIGSWGCNVIHVGFY